MYQPSCNKKHSLSVFSLLLVSGQAFSAIQPGDILISEVMANPAAVSDSNGEWIELYNASSTVIDLNGFRLSDSGSNNHLIAAASPLLIDPGAFVVLGRQADSSINGGVTVDYVYQSFTLGNSADDIILSLDAMVIDQVSYSSGELFGQAGISAERINGIFALTPESYSYGDGDHGTPGAANSAVVTAPAAVPLPASAWLLLSSLCGLVGIKRSAGQTPA